MSISSKFVLPFKLKFRSQVTGGYAQELHTQYFPNTEITNYHKDDVDIDSEENVYTAILQSPFTERWVGGRSYRHINFNTGSDTSALRPEAFHVDLQPQEIRLYSHAFRNSPPAYWTRDGRAKRPVNIANIDYDGRSEGNYRENYEFLQTSGRRISNNLIVDGFTATGVLTTQFVNGLTYSVSKTIEEDFSSFTTGQEVDNDNFESSAQSVVKTGTLSPYIGKNFLVLSDTSGARYLKFKQQFTGEVSLQYKVLVNRTLAGNIYDAGGLYLEYPDSTDILYLEYSLDNVNWTTLTTVLVGGITTGGVQENSITFTANPPTSSPYYLRWTQTYSGGAPGFDHYAITDIVASYTGYDNSYTLPELNKENGSRSVIVERFNAPGSKEESSRGALDREGEEMSPNIPLPFRNIKIRQPFYRQLAQHSPQFGSGSTYELLPRTGSTNAVTIHKVNRNRLPGTGSVNDLFDNGFVVHAIPRTDIQYTWITASAVTTAADLRGYQSYRTSDYSRRPGYNDITFMSSSLVTSGSNEQHEIDNFYLNSLSKNTKIVNLDTNTFSMSASLSASYAEVANNNYGFPIWGSLRLADTPVARNLRKENILSILDTTRTVVLSNGVVEQRRAETSTNYSEPAVTFKYRALENDLLIDGHRYKIKTDYTNLLSTFANKDLIERNKLFPEIRENTNTIYDYLRNEYKKDDRVKYVAHKYSEVVWPKEERTGLSQTRKREAYYLDLPGFTRDGYDIQLGTQRAFWRDSQEDRKRSDNLDGGYYNSLNYLSTEETGGSFSISDTLEYLDGESYSYQAILNHSSDFSLFNSLITLESSSNIEYSVFDSTFIVKDTSPTPDDFKAAYYKTSSISSVNGEFNEAFIDFYGMLSSSNNSQKIDLGSIYRNSYYKSFHTRPPYEFGSTRDTNDVYNLIKTEDDEISMNPKPRYISFTGGGEFFDSTYITTNFIEGIVSPQTENIPSDLFEQSLHVNDLQFTTMDNGLQRVTENDSGKKPFFDSYEDYLQEIYPMTKDMSQIPEFTISEHISDYIQNPLEFSKDYSILMIDGADSTNYRSGNSRNDRNKVFLKNYCTSDLLKKHEKVFDDNKEISDLENINIKVSGIKKLLPYNGFYAQDRTIQLANIYGDFVDNSLEGGYYSISYENTREEEIVCPSSRLGTAPVTVSDFVEFGGRFYAALGQPSNNEASIIRSPSSGDIFATWITRYNEIKGSNNFGLDVKLLSGSNGLHVFISEADNSYNGKIYHDLTSEGEVLPKPPVISQLVSYTSTPIEGGTSSDVFGQKIDAIYDENNSLYILAISAPEDSTTVASGGEIYVVTSSDGTSWSNKFRINRGGTFTGLGKGMSLYSASNGYNIAASTDSGIVNFNFIQAGFSTSTQTVTLSNRDSVVSGKTSVNIGAGGVKALEYDNKSFFFYSCPLENGDFVSQAGNVYVSYTGDNHNYSAVVEKTLYSGIRTNENATVDSFYLETVTAQVTPGNKLRYSFGIPGYKIGDGAFYTGEVDQSLNFLAARPRRLDNGSGYGVSSFISGNYYVSAYSNTLENLYLLREEKQVALDVVVSGSEAEKCKKMSALEPLFAPGIIYNTIKSGIAVDWPCATGSTSFRSIDDVIINGYMPATVRMFEYEGSNGTYNTNGSLKSEIDFRIPFENIFNPSEMFETASISITSNRTEYYDYSINEIPSQSLIKQFINKKYIFGHYEPYTDPSSIQKIIFENAKRFSVPFVYKKTGKNENNLFTMAINNFFAETVNFFLEEGKLVTFESKPDNEWAEFKNGKIYYMDVVLEKTPDLIMMESYHSDKHPTGSNGEKMNGRYFGYPVNKTIKDVWAEEFTSDEAKLIHNDPAYAPYTPPYFEGKAIARISFEPEVTGKYTVTEVLERINIESIFVEAANGWTPGSDAHLNSMPVEASIDLRGIAKVVRSEVRQRMQQTDSTVLTELPDNKKWVISTRMETPVLDFSDQEIVTYQNNYIRKSGYGRGMWSGYGKLPTSGSGISVEISYPFGRDFVDPYSRANAKQNLLQHIGFKAESKKVGQIRRNGKQIKEAVVLIPYLQNPNAASRREYTTRQRFFQDLYFISINRAEYNKQKRRIEAGENATDTKENTSISRMIETMKDYVIPPYLDFLNDSSIKPFVMYLAEFEHQFTQQDLVDMWQGLMPDISYNAELEEVEISHPSAPDEFFHGKNLPDNLRWLVFRVKQRAIYDFGKITSSTKDDQRFAQNTIVGREGVPYSYNWPYDFCSLVEFGKVELELNYKKKTTVI